MLPLLNLLKVQEAGFIKDHMSVIESMITSQNLQAGSEWKDVVTKCALNDWLIQQKLPEFQAQIQERLVKDQKNLKLKAEDLSQMTQLQKLSVLRGGLSQPCKEKDVTSLKTQHFKVIDSILSDQVESVSNLGPGDLIYVAQRCMDMIQNKEL